MRNTWSTCALLLLVACGPGGRPDDGNDGHDDTGPDAGEDLPDGVVGAVYAHTADALYKIDPDTLAVTKVGNFQWSNGPDMMTDIAVDRNGLMLGVSFGAVYRIDQTNAVATRMGVGLPGVFNGLSFVPATMIGQTGADVLVGTRNSDGVVHQIDPMTGMAHAIGNMGGFRSSGDLVAVKNYGIAQTTDNGDGTPDGLVSLAANTFAGTMIGSIGYDEIWGIAFWKGNIFGFTSDGKFITINPTTGQGTLVQSNGPEWWGAAVSTVAPVIF